MNTRYDLNMEVPPREAVRLLYISKSRFGGDWRSVPHTHACTEMFYCVSGRGQFNIEGKLFDVAPDDLIIVNPRVQHTELSYQTQNLIKAKHRRPGRQTGAAAICLIAST